MGGVARVQAEGGALVAAEEAKLAAEGVVGLEAWLAARPEEAEEEAVRRVCSLATQCPLPITFTCPTSLSALAVMEQFRAAGLDCITGEPAAAALLLDGSHYSNPCPQHAAAFLCSPPLRGLGSPAGLVAGLVAGQLESVSSAHCARAGAAPLPGLTGAEERMAVVHAAAVAGAGLELEQFVCLTSANTAKLLNCFPRKGCVAVGSDADLVVWEELPEPRVLEKSEQSAAPVNIFSGQEMQGGAEWVVAGGRVVVAHYAVKAGPGDASFVPAAAFPACYESLPSLPEPRRVERGPVRLAQQDRADGPGREAEFGLTCPRGYQRPGVLNKQLGRLVTEQETRLTFNFLQGSCSVRCPPTASATSRTRPLV